MVSLLWNRLSSDFIFHSDAMILSAFALSVASLWAAAAKGALRSSSTNASDAGAAHPILCFALVELLNLESRNFRECALRVSLEIRSEHLRDFAVLDALPI
jgi:hypothetical protein